MTPTGCIFTPLSSDTMLLSSLYTRINTTASLFESNISSGSNLSGVDIEGDQSNHKAKQKQLIKESIYS